ncbi:GNAT family N-acetyltransferase [Pseudomonas brassicacearum]|uniref:GNAT family N-acetyltransferase n=1 Tax=Pseudomonas brassicacearum TaxID=930166 RepID=UPI0011F234BE|nr:GNAT family N-acetyltransferase [Pseudomonas brassicacearum]QEO79554.1 GNAT family N-acetyltransferase [Pseudomonas brassicacearum]
MTLRIERTDTPTDEERQAILAPLRAYNTAKTGGTVPELVAWLVRDEQDEIVGGLYGRVFFRWLYIELLVVPEQGPGPGPRGSTLMQMAEELAREKNCVGIWLDTFDFQRRSSYRRHGFTECGQIDDYPPGHQRFFFRNA